MGKDQIRAAALKLSTRDREALALELLETVYEPGATVGEAQWKTAWRAELARRVSEIDAGTTEMVAEDELFAELDVIVGANKG
jgi:putative addiction module component (TIGR02574 family)